MYTNGTKSLQCPLCPQITLYTFEETGVHLSLVHHLSFSAHILANTMWTSIIGYQQAGHILKDVGIMNQVLKNMKNNVDKMENKIKLQENGMMSIKLDGVDKSCQSDLHVEDAENKDIKPVIEGSDSMHGKGGFESEFIKMELIDVDTEIKGECLVADVNNNIGDDRTVTSIAAGEGTREMSSPKSDSISVQVWRPAVAPRYEKSTLCF